METKELRIQVPDGYEIDKENSTFEKIVFKRKKDQIWAQLGATISGYYINEDSEIIDRPRSDQYYYGSSNYNIFATEKQAKSALAMARISQIMANDERFGGPVTDEQWVNIGYRKYLIHRTGDILVSDSTGGNVYEFLAFHTSEQRDLFLKENEHLIKDYLMID